ncbi:MAG: hypothetical protein JNK18_09830 [Cyclobacteriaceae bacterium]|nr:hypothetical protein [Cyclobacteriaceae bacterium]
MEAMDIIDVAARMIGYVFLIAFAVLTVWKFGAMIKILIENIRPKSKKVD